MVPAALVTVHVAVPAPSPVRASTLSATDPLSVPDAGCDWSKTGLEVTAAHVTLAGCRWGVSAPDASIGKTRAAKVVTGGAPTTVRRAAGRGARQEVPP